MTGQRLRIATRGSALARAQAESVASAIHAALDVEVELVTVSTRGDRDSAALTAIGGQGVFVGAVREAVVSGRADIAVHSLKDLPSEPDRRVELAAVPQRREPADALVARDRLTVDSLPVAAMVGTGSPRRAAQLLSRRPDLEVVAVRGNVDTRLGLVRDGKLDAVVVAAAGLLRLGRESEITEVIGYDVMLPAPGQGALAVEVSAQSADLGRRIREVLDDSDARSEVTAERAVLSTLSAGCTAPVGALAQVTDAPERSVRLRAVAATPDGRQAVRLEALGPAEAAEELGRGLARSMLDQGATELLSEPVP